jgi:hypothetical protein
MGESNKSSINMSGNKKHDRGKMRPGIPSNMAYSPFDEEERAK